MTQPFLAYKKLAQTKIGLNNQDGKCSSEQMVQLGVARFISDKEDFKPKSVKRDKDSHFTLIK
jgi:hypothetical protein